MTVLNLLDMTTSFRALETLAREYPQLPTATFHLRGTTMAAEQVIDVQLYQQPEGFTAWCEVFEIDTATLETRSNGFNHYTRAVVRYAGVTFVITLDHLDREWRTEPVAVAA